MLGGNNGSVTARLLEKELFRARQWFCGVRHPYRRRELSCYAAAKEKKIFLGRALYTSPAVTWCVGRDVTNADGTTITLAGGYTSKRVAAPSVWTDLLGRNESDLIVRHDSRSFRESRKHDAYWFRCG